QLRDQKEQAVESMRREVANNPQNYKFILELAELLLEYERYDDAITELKKVTSLPSTAKAPEYRAEKIRAYLLASRCYRAKNQGESAESAIKLAMALDSSDPSKPELSADPELHRELGYVYYLLQRDTEGVKEFEFYLQRNPAARDSATIRG